MMGCDFCDELGGRPGTRFHALYGNLTDSRIALETANFAALPTLGQVFSGSMLIIPKMHVETSARISPALREELTALVDRVIETSRHHGSPVFFEHGALSCTGGSCGIYHAHIHIMPVPTPIPPNMFIGEEASMVTHLTEALQALEDSEQYLLFGTDQGIAYSDVATLKFKPPSQYMRRALAEHFQVSRTWDWRQATRPEPELLATLSLFGGGDVLERQRDPA